MKKQIFILMIISLLCMSFLMASCSGCQQTYTFRKKTSKKESYVDRRSNLEFFLQEDDTYAVGIGSNKGVSRVEIPMAFNGRYVTAIQQEGFMGLEYLDEVIMPDTIIYIGEYAFAECPALEDISLGKGVKEIADYAFSNCVNLKTFRFCEDLQIIGSKVFNKCTKLLNIYYNGSIDVLTQKSLVDLMSTDTTDMKYFHALFKDTTLYNSFYFYINDEIPTEIEITSAQLIGSGAFAFFGYLEKAIIGESVQSMGNNVFYSCPYLEELIIKANVERLEYRTCYNCQCLERIVLPKSLKTIGFKAFVNCNYLSKVYYMGSASDWEKITFETFGTYKSNQQIINATKYYYSESEPTEAGNFWHYDTDGTTILEWKID